MRDPVKNPVVSVICISHNHAPFVAEALESVLAQTYDSIELIIADDASTDNGVEVIKQFMSKATVEIRFMANKNNVGHCKVFNKALEQSTGEFIIDLAADDLLEANRVEVGVNELLTKGEAYGVHFSDATLIDKNSTFLNYHRTKNFFKSGKVSEGDIYEMLLKKYFISPPTMMYTRKVIDALGGYDEQLYYEDFDFWVRSARNFKYCYSPQLLVKKRILNDSKSSGQYKLGSKMIKSTLIVCHKAFTLNRSQSEFKALDKRIRYELRQALLSGNLVAVWGFVKLFLKNAQKIRQLDPH